METKVNYVVVGLFALLLSAAMIAGVLWLSAGKKYSMVVDTYIAYMNESVSGLNLNAPVKYRGVEVGQVRLIKLDKVNPEQVLLELSIERGIPIKQDTIATLRSQGLTGIAFIELSGGSTASPLLEPNRLPPYPVIRTGPSLMGRLDNALSSLLNNLNKTTENLNALLDEENRMVLKNTLADVSVLTRTLASHRADIDKSVSNAAQISAQLPQLIEKVGRATEALEKMAKDTSRASISVRKTMDDVGPDAKRFANDGLPELERMMVSLREMMVSLQRVTEQIEQNPGVLLRGREVRQRGPGE